MQLSNNSKMCARYPQDCRNEDGNTCEYMNSNGRNSCRGLNWEDDTKDIVDIERRFALQGFHRSGVALEFTRENWNDQYDYDEVRYLIAWAKSAGYEVSMSIYKTAATGPTVGHEGRGIMGYSLNKTEDWHPAKALPFVGVCTLITLAALVAAMMAAP